jgi:hypothetical protein
MRRRGYTAFKPRVHSERVPFIPYGVTIEVRLALPREDRCGDWRIASTLTALKQNKPNKAMELTSTGLAPEILDHPGLGETYLRYRLRRSHFPASPVLR